MSRCFWTVNIAWTSWESGLMGVFLFLWEEYGYVALHILGVLFGCSIGGWNMPAPLFMVTGLQRFSDGGLFLIVHE